MNNLLKIGDIRKFSSMGNEIVGVVIGIEERTQRYIIVTSWGETSLVSFDFKVSVVKLPKEIRTALQGIGYQSREKAEHEACIRRIDENLIALKGELHKIFKDSRAGKMPF